MKRSTKVLVGAWLVVVAVLLTAIAMKGNDSSAKAANAGNAAFRDGMYQAKLAAQKGERPHPSVARWSRDSDRRAYVAGYQEGYLATLGQSGITVPNGAEEAGYRDGLQDGSQDRQNFQSFRTAAHSEDHGNLKTNGLYRAAYDTAYQLGFYGRQQVQHTLVIRPVSLSSF